MPDTEEEVERDRQRARRWDAWIMSPDSYEYRKRSILYHKILIAKKNKERKDMIKECTFAKNNLHLDRKWKNVKGTYYEKLFNTRINCSLIETKTTEIGKSYRFLINGGAGYNKWVNDFKVEVPEKIILPYSEEYNYGPDVRWCLSDDFWKEIVRDCKKYGIKYD